VWQHIIIVLLDEEILKYFVYTGEHFTCVISPLLRNNNIAAAYVSYDVCLPGSDLRNLIVQEIFTSYKHYKCRTWLFQRGKLIGETFNARL